MYQLQVFFKKNHNMGHNVTTRNAISFSQKFLKLFQKYLLDGEKVLLILALQLSSVWFAFTWIRQLGQSIIKPTWSRFFIMKTHYGKKEFCLGDPSLNKFFFKWFIDSTHLLTCRYSISREYLQLSDFSSKWNNPVHLSQYKTHALLFLQELSELSEIVQSCPVIPGVMFCS